MPIHLNLLAEAQAEEEMRRRDPVKRAIMVGCGVMGLVLLWCIILQIRIFSAKSQLTALENRFNAHAAQFNVYTANQAKRTDVNHRLEDLQRLAANRFLIGNLLNALQHATLDGVQLMRFSIRQSYFMSEAVKAKTTDSGRMTIGKPGFATEKVTIQLDAKDSSGNPGDLVGKFKDALANTPYFQKALGKTNEFSLKNLSPTFYDAENNKPAVSFSIGCKLPDRYLQ